MNSWFANSMKSTFLGIRLPPSLFPFRGITWANKLETLHHINAMWAMRSIFVGVLLRSTLQACSLNSYQLNVVLSSGKEADLVHHGCIRVPCFSLRIPSSPFVSQWCSIFCPQWFSLFHHDFPCWRFCLPLPSHLRSPCLPTMSLSRQLMRFSMQGNGSGFRIFGGHLSAISQTSNPTVEGPCFSLKTNFFPARTFFLRRKPEFKRLCFLAKENVSSPTPDPAAGPLIYVF